MLSTKKKNYLCYITANDVISSKQTQKRRLHSGLEATVLTSRQALPDCKKRWHRCARIDGPDSLSQKHSARNHLSTFTSLAECWPRQSTVSWHGWFMQTENTKSSSTPLLACTFVLACVYLPVYICASLLVFFAEYTYLYALVMCFFACLFFWVGVCFWVGLCCHNKDFTAR